VLLLDTNALIWLGTGDDKLAVKVKRLIEQKIYGGVATSVLSFWEFGCLAGQGRIRMRCRFADARHTLLDRGVMERSVTSDAVMDALGLENLSPDPFDRLIVATARTLGATLVTSDRRILAWRGEVERLDARA
jgi:PIN domain nuclease of toxin-antitoxin system